MTDVGRRRLAVGTTAAIVTTLIATAGVGAVRTVDYLVELHGLYAPLDRNSREQLTGSREGFDPAEWAFLRRALNDGETYLVVTPAGRGAGTVDERFVTRTFASYRLLPAVQVTTRAEADVVVYIKGKALSRAVCATPARTACILRTHP